MSNDPSKQSGSNVNFPNVYAAMLVPMMVKYKEKKHLASLTIVMFVM